MAVARRLGATIMKRYVLRGRAIWNVGCAPQRGLKGGDSREVQAMVAGRMVQRPGACPLKRSALVRFDTKRDEVHQGSCRKQL